MEENQDSIGVIEKLALLADAMENIFPDGKPIVVFQLKQEDYKSVQTYFRTIDHHHKQFKIDMSGVEMVFILDELLKDETNSP
jgi:hypothetical protein